MKLFFALFSLLLGPTLFSAEIKKVDFLQEGETSKLVVEVDDDLVKANRFHITENKQIILDLKDVEASHKILRGIDTSEFPGSIVFINAYKKNDNSGDIRFAIQLRDNVRSILNQVGKKFVLSIENRFGVFSQAKVQSAEANGSNINLEAERKANENTMAKVNIPKSESIEDILENVVQSGPKKYIGKKISINVKNIDISDLLKMMAETSGFNIILDKDVSGIPPLTLSLTNVPWDQALDTILGIGKLVAKKNANILAVTTLDKATKEKELEIKNKEIIKKEEPLVTKVFPISFAKLSEMDKILKEYSTPERGKISLDERTNSIIVKDTIDTIERMKKIIETLDTQTPQVLIEAKIVEATEGYSKEVGFKRGLTFGYDPIGSVPNPLPVATGNNNGFSFSSAPTSASSTALGLTFDVFKRLKGLNFQLALMENESKAKVISSPKIITQNKKEASFSSSDKRLFRNVTFSGGVTTTSFQEFDAAITLKVTPQITNEGSISMEIDVNKGEFGEQTVQDTPPPVNNRTIKTNVLVDNGSTIVIGGFHKVSQSENHSGIPFLKDIPLLGWLFRTPYNPSSSRTELIFFLTPRIINQEEAGLVDQSASNIQAM